MIKNFIILSIIIFFFCTATYAQIPDRSQTIEELIEEIAESSDEELDYTSLFDDLFYYSQFPLNLNSATRFELEKLQFLNDFQIEGILEYQYRAGEMQTIYELQLVDGFDKKDIERLLPFVMVAKIEESSLPKIGKILKYGRQSIFLRTQFYTQKQQGYDDQYTGTQFLGDKYKHYAKYQFDFKRKVQFGFVAEKDPGEEFFSGSQKYGFDYYSAHLFISGIGKIKSFAVGDFQAKFGQGLISWTGMSTGKSSYVTDVKKTYDGIRKYSSTDENKFLRGVGGTVELGDFDLTAFFSYKNIDANIDVADTSSVDEEIASSFQITGYHRTPSELEGKDAISEMIYGGNLKWKQEHFNIGASFIHYFFGAMLNKRPQPYNMFDFNSDENFNFSIDYKATYRNFYFFGEEAMSQNGAYALLNGVSARLAPQLAFSLLHRYYQRDYQAYFAGGFGEQSNTANEEGMYMGAEITPYKSLRISAYFDTYTFPWLKFRTNSPSYGTDYFVQADYSINRYVNMYVKYKQETKLENSSDEFTGVLPTLPYTRKQFRYHINYKLSRNLTLKNRVEISNFVKENQEKEDGFVIYQDVSYNVKRIPLNASFRFAMFDATYNSRIYAYETDVLYGFSIPAYFDKGIRTYLTLKYTVVPDFIDVWLRYALFSYTNKDVIGSGNTEIQGNNKSEVKFQIRIKL